MGDVVCVEDDCVCVWDWDWDCACGRVLNRNPVDMPISDETGE